MDELRVNNSSVAPQQTRKPTRSVPPEEVRETAQQPNRVEAEQATAVQTVAGQEQERQTSAAEQPAEQVEAAVAKLNDYVQSVQRSLQFDFDEDAGKTVITVVDKETNEVIRKIPDEYAIKLAQKLNGDEKVSLFNTKV